MMNDFESSSLEEAETAWSDEMEEDIASSNLDALDVPFGASRGHISFDASIDLMDEDQGNLFTDEDGDMFLDAQWKSDGGDYAMPPPLRNEESGNALHFSDNEIQANTFHSVESSFDTNDSSRDRVKTIRFATQLAIPIGIATLDDEDHHFDDAANESLELDGMDFSEAGHQKPPSSERSLEQDSEGSMDLLGLIQQNDGNEQSKTSVNQEEKDDEKDEEAEIKRGLMYAAGGMGFMAFMGWGMGKLKEAFSKGQDEPTAGVDALQQTTGDLAGQTLQDAATTAALGDPSTSTAIAMQAAQANAFGASTASASQSQSAIAFAYIPGKEGAMTAAQANTVGSMAVGAASNVAAGAAVTTSTIATTAAVAGAVAAAGLSAATATIAATAAVATVGVGVAGGAIYSEVQQEKVVQQAVAATDCDPNPVISSAYTRIMFNSAEFPADLPVMFQQAYNDVAGCDETYKRLSLDAQVEDGFVREIGPALVYETWWSTQVSCSPQCPTEPLFGMTLSDEDEALSSNGTRYRRFLEQNEKLHFDALNTLSVRLAAATQGANFVIFGTPVVGNLGGELLESVYLRPLESSAPSDVPSASPSGEDSESPSLEPTVSEAPTGSAPPSSAPSAIPTGEENDTPSLSPSGSPSTSFPTFRNTDDDDDDEDVSGAPSESPITAFPTFSDTVSGTSSTAGEVSPSPTGIEPSIVPSSSPSEIDEKTSTSPSRSPTGTQPSSTSPPGLDPTVTPSVSVSPTGTEPIVEPSSVPSGDSSSNPIEESLSSDTPTELDVSIASSSLPSEDASAFSSGSPTEVDPLSLEIDSPSSVPSKEEPSMMPSENPSEAPSSSSSIGPSNEEPSIMPSESPSEVPLKSPSSGPSNIPSVDASESPSITPTGMPTPNPTREPTATPTNNPTGTTTTPPTTQPSGSPTRTSTASPTASAITANPTRQPTQGPTSVPVADPTLSQTELPTLSPTDRPTAQPTGSPTAQPFQSPTNGPTNQPTDRPTGQPTQSPTDRPTEQPTGSPTAQPTQSPTNGPTDQPTDRPTGQPTQSPTDRPTEQPTDRPTGQPTQSPTTGPTDQPTDRPTAQPTPLPTLQPTENITPFPTIANGFDCVEKCQLDGEIVNLNCENGVTVCGTSGNDNGRTCGCCAPRSWLNTCPNTNIIPNQQSGEFELVGNNLETCCPLT